MSPAHKGSPAPWSTFAQQASGSSQPYYTHCHTHYGWPSREHKSEGFGTDGICYTWFTFTLLQLISLREEIVSPTPLYDLVVRITLSLL